MAKQLNDFSPSTCIKQMETMLAFYSRLQEIICKAKTAKHCRNSHFTAQLLQQVFTLVQTAGVEC